MSEDSSARFEPPGALLGGFAAAQFAVLLNNVGLAERSLCSDVALFAAATALPFLLATWVIVKDSEKAEATLTASLTVVAVAACLLGYLALVSTILHVSLYAGATFGIAGLAALIFAWRYEERHAKKG